jgi:hypothetical protein
MSCSQRTADSINALASAHADYRKDVHECKQHGDKPACERQEIDVHNIELSQKELINTLKACTVE